MGGSASRELESAKAQVVQLTLQVKQMQAHASSVRPVVLPSAKAAAAAAAVATSSPLEAKNKLLQKQLAARDEELAAAKKQLNSVTAVDMPRFKQEISQTKEELRLAMLQREEKDSELTELQKQLRASKEELEAVFGKLKFAETENASINKRRSNLSDDKRALVEQQRAQASEAAIAVAEASAALDTVQAASSGIEAWAERHPVYGELLHDFGHKRVYCGSPTTLWAGTVLWERQRAFRQERATLIANAKAKSAMGWPGAVSVVETVDGSTSGLAADAATGGDGAGGVGDGASPIGMLIDGQHRLGAAHVLAQRQKLSGPLAQILVEVYPPMEEGQVKELFVEINRAEPVLLVDMPSEGGATDSDNEKLTSAAEVLRERYPEMFKPSHNCRPPHLNVDVLREHMHKAELISRLKVGDADELVEWVEARNAKLGALREDEWASLRAKSGSAHEKALTKARDNSFYLGLTWEWLQDAKPEKAARK